jgi:succinate dehydrogenase/fumarate reductase flavoprotein subunit
MKYKIIITEILVIGAGGAGLRAAIEAKKKGTNVYLLGKEVLGCAHTGMAMGGMNAAMVKPATSQFHAQITMEGGYFINNEKLVKVFTDEMPDRVYDLEKYGVIFDR